MPVLQLVGELGMIFGTMAHGQALEDTVLEDIDEAPVGDPRNGQSRDGRKRRLVIERRSEKLARLREERRPALGSLRSGAGAPFAVQQLAPLLFRALAPGDIPDKPREERP